MGFRGLRALRLVALQLQPVGQAPTHCRRLKYSSHTRDMMWCLALKTITIARTNRHDVLAFVNKPDNRVIECLRCL